MFTCKLFSRISPRFLHSVIGARIPCLIHCSLCWGCVSAWVWRNFFTSILRWNSFEEQLFFLLHNSRTFVSLWPRHDAYSCMFGNLFQVCRHSKGFNGGFFVYSEFFFLFLTTKISQYFIVVSGGSLYKLYGATSCFFFSYCLHSGDLWPASTPVVTYLQVEEVKWSLCGVICSINMRRKRCFLYRWAFSHG